MSEEELKRKILSGAFSMQVADCERNIRIQFEKLQQENQQLKNDNAVMKANLIEVSDKQRDLYKSIIDEVREFRNNHIMLIYTNKEPREMVGVKKLDEILDKAKESEEK